MFFRFTTEETIAEIRKEYPLLCIMNRGNSFNAVFNRGRSLLGIDII